MGNPPTFYGDEIPLESHIIEVRIRKLRQLFDSLDPSPFIALDLEQTCPDKDAVIAEMLADLKASERIDEQAPILYPGEKEYQTRLDNLANGVPVVDSVWETILSLQ